jgi:CspA family cold shock protein
MDGRLTGTLRNKNVDKGFAFIRRGDGEADVFIHRSAFKHRPGDWDGLSDGQSLEFAIEDRGKGPRAKDVVIL